MLQLEGTLRCMFPSFYFAEEWGGQKFPQVHEWLCPGTFVVWKRWFTLDLRGGRDLESLPIHKGSIKPPHCSPPPPPTTRSGFVSAMELPCYRRLVQHLEEVYPAWSSLHLYSRTTRALQSPIEFVVDRDGWVNGQSETPYFLTEGLSRF